MVQRLTERRIEEDMTSEVEVIRVAGPNAGHTGHDKKGNPWAFRQLPVAAVVPGPVILGIAAGSEIDPDVLVDELQRASEAGLLDGKKVWISDEATIIEDHHKETESEEGLVKKVGSTGKGIGAARAARVMRRAKRLADCPDIKEKLREAWKYVKFNQAGVNRCYGGWARSIPLIIEGAQGYGLGVHAGHYPQSTSSDCRAIDFLSMAGINPWNWSNEDVHVWVVARTYPIRVAGNSGPLKGETTWSELGLPQERTTVTQKVRRVGEPDWDFVKKAVEANGPAQVHLAVFMLDQMFPQAAGRVTVETLPVDATNYISEVIEKRVGAKVDLVGTGPNSVVWRSYRPGGERKTDAPEWVWLPGGFKPAKHKVVKETTPEQVVRKWWADTAQGHIDMVVPKMVEYGSNDLVEIGREFLALAGIKEASDSFAHEVGILFYARGKLARWSAAVGRGEHVSRDTLDDIVAYAMMAILNQEESK